MRIFLVVFMEAIIMLGSLNAQIEEVKTDEERTRSEVLIRFKAGVSESEIQDLLNQHGLTVIQEYELLENLFLCRTREGQDLNKLLGIVNLNPDVEYAEANQKVEALDVES